MLHPLFEVIRTANNSHPDTPIKARDYVAKALKETFAIACNPPTSIKELLLEKNADGIGYLHLVVKYCDKKFLNEVLRKARYTYWGIPAAELEKFIAAYSHVIIPDLDNPDFQENYDLYLHHFSEQPMRDQNLENLLTNISNATTKKELLSILMEIHTLFTSVPDAKQKEIEDKIIAVLLRTYINTSTVTPLQNNAFHPGQKFNFFHSLLLEQAPALNDAILQLMNQFSKNGITALASSVERRKYSSLSLAILYSPGIFAFFNNALENNDLIPMLTAGNVDNETPVHLAAAGNTEALELIAIKFPRHAYSLFSKRTKTTPLEKAQQAKNTSSELLIKTVLGNFSDLALDGFNETQLKDIIQRHFNDFHLMQDSPNAQHLVEEFYKLSQTSREHYLAALGDKLNLLVDQEIDTPLYHRKRIARKLFDTLRDSFQTDTAGVRDLFLLVLQKTVCTNPSEEISFHREYCTRLQRIFHDRIEREKKIHYTLFNLRNPHRVSNRLFVSLEKMAHATLGEDTFPRKYSATPWNELHDFIVDKANMKNGDFHDFSTTHITKRNSYAQEPLLLWYVAFFQARFDRNQAALDVLSNSFHRPRKTPFSNSKTDTDEAKFKDLVREAYLAEPNEFDFYVAFINSAAVDDGKQAGVLLIRNLKKAVAVESGRTCLNA